MKKRILSLLLAFVLVFSFASCAGENNETEATTEYSDSNAHTHGEEDAEPNPAPDFTVYGKDGKPVRLSDMKGTPVVLNFWASWCPPCKAEMPDFDKIAKEYEGRIVFMMVNLTDGVSETQSSAQAFIDSMGYTFPVYFDLDSEAAYTYGTQSIPTTYFIDAKGDLIAGANGAIDGDTLRSGISMIYTEAK